MTIELNPRERRLYDRVRAALSGLDPGGSFGVRDVLLLMPDLTVLLMRLIRDRRVPLGAKAVALVGVGYVISPIDLLPAVFIGPLGWLDDALVVTAALGHILNEVHPDLVRAYYRNEAVPVDSDRHAALHAAFWSGGSFLYLPKNVKVELPFVSVMWQEMPKLAVFPPTLLVAEEGSSVTLVSELLSMGCEACPDTYHGGVTELFLGAGARVQYINTQDLGRHVYDLRTQAPDFFFIQFYLNLGVICGFSVRRQSNDKLIFPATFF